MTNITLVTTLAILLILNIGLTWLVIKLRKDIDALYDEATFNLYDSFRLTYLIKRLQEFAIKDRDERQTYVVVSGSSVLAHDSTSVQTLDLNQIGLEELPETNIFWTKTQLDKLASFKGFELIPLIQTNKIAEYIPVETFSLAATNNGNLMALDLNAMIAAMQEE